ncbi:MAG: type II toxin-antitoxin system CcdA family antitoxin [Panacagrimonas sp.]
MPGIADNPGPAAQAKTPRSASPTRRRVNLSLRASTIDGARELGLNISRIAEDKLAEAVREEKSRRWTEENREAIEAYNERIKRDGPLNADLLSF